MSDDLTDLLPPLAEASKRLTASARKPRKERRPEGWVTFEEWARPLKWLDGKPLLRFVEPYRLDIFRRALDGHDGAARVKYSMVLASRAKKNAKSADLVIAALFKLLGNDQPNGNQCYIIANDSAQASDDLTIAKKVVKANPKQLGELVRVLKNTVERRDGGGFLEVLPKNDAAGAHGKTYTFCGWDEIHAYREEDYDILEALALDPTRGDAQTWVTTYASLRHKPGVPLYDFFTTGQAGADPKMLFSWYGADYCTDPSMDGKTPEERANPSMGRGFDPDYLESQRRRLPSQRFNRLHLNLPGLPEGSAFSLEKVMAAVDKGVASRPPEAGIKYLAFVDMSGGGDDAVLCVGHEDPASPGTAVVDIVVDQGQPSPFDPNRAVPRWAPTLRGYGVTGVTGDVYGGDTFGAQFRAAGFQYRKADVRASDLYELAEVPLNAGRVRLTDAPKVTEQLLGLQWRGDKIDHAPSSNDDHANAVCGLVYLVSKRGQGFAPLVGVVNRDYLSAQASTANKEKKVPSAEQAGQVHPHERREAPAPGEMSGRKASAWRDGGPVEFHREDVQVQCMGCGVRLPDTESEHRKHLRERGLCASKQRGFA